MTGRGQMTLIFAGKIQESLFGDVLQNLFLAAGIMLSTMTRLPSISLPEGGQQMATPAWKWSMKPKPEVPVASRK